MSGPLRIVVGEGMMTPGAHARLALQLADHARRIGFVLVAHAMSRSCVRSPSRYLSLADPRGRSWIVRVSNHRWPAPAGREVPNLDLVSIDGVAGLAEGCTFLDRALGGGIQWRDPVAGVRQPKKRRRR